MKGVLVETDLIAEFLTAGSDGPSLLRRLLEVITCYTTFLNAAEIYSAARDDEERRTVERALFGLKILGASARYAKTIGAALSSDVTGIDHRKAIVAGMAIESDLAIVTDFHYRALTHLPSLKVIPAAALRATHERSSLEEALTHHR